VSRRIDRLGAALVFDVRYATFHVVVNVGIGSGVVPQHLRRALSPTVVSLDVTPLNIDRMADAYRHHRQAVVAERFKLEVNRRIL